MKKQAFGNNKWPNVPDCYGWLSLDARGYWRIRKTPVSHRKLQDYLNENYQCDKENRWFVQNGPQRVFVELESTPWIYRLCTDKPSCLVSHTNQAAGKILGIFQDDEGNLLVSAQLGFGALDDRDLGALSDMIEEKGDKLLLGLGPENFVVREITQKQIDLRWPYVSTPQYLAP